jgi:tetratricopeptide (TPR) repeat protein
VLFALHPVHEWVVNYIVGRSDLLQMFFSLLSLLLFVRFIQREKSYWYVLSIIGFVLGLLSREATILFPLYILIVSCVLSRGFRRAIHDTIPFLCISVGYFLLRESVSPVVGEGMQSFSWAQILQWKILTGQYYLRFFFPWSVSSNYFYIFDNLYLFGAVWFLLLTGIVYFSQHDHQFHQRPQVFGSLWLIAGAISLYPTTHMFARLGPYLSEHFLYFPSIGFVILMAAFLLRLKKNSARWIFGGLILIMACITFENNTYWTTEKDLLKRVYAKEEGRKTVAYEQLLMRYTDDPWIVKSYMTGLDNSYTQSLWNNRLGHIYAEKKDYLHAEKYLLKAIEFNPRNWEAQNALAVVYLNQGDLQQGKDLLLRVIQLDSENRDAYRLLGEVAYNHKNYSEAVSNLNHALFYDPDDVTLLGYLAMAYLLSAEIKNYQQTVDEIFKKSHDTKKVILFFINELGRHGFHQEAVELMEQNKRILFQ